MAKQEISVQVNMISFAYGIAGVSERQRYLRALQDELAAASDYADDYVVGALCITGASPLQYPVDALANVIKTIKQHIDFQRNAEITVNALPGSVTYADLRALAEQGVNRIAFDMRTFVQSELDALGRTYSPNAVEVFMRMVQLKFVFFHYEIALYYGLPGQTLESLRYSIEQAIRFMGTNITLLPYNDEQKPEQASFYHEAARAIIQHGFQQYTPLHFTRPGYASRWNKRAYSNQPRLGFGVDALSKIDGTTGQNTADVAAYMAADGDPADIIAHLEPISENSVVSSAILDRLFTLEAIEIAPLNTTQRNIVSALCERGLLQFNGKSAVLTEAGKANWRAISSTFMG